MKILLTLSTIPIPDGEAIDVVSNEILNWLSKNDDVLHVQSIIREKNNDSFKELEMRFQEAIKNNENIVFEDVIYLGDFYQNKTFIQKIFLNIKNVILTLPIMNNIINKSFFPAMIAKSFFEKRIHNINPDIIVSIWSWESLSLIYNIKNIPKYVYYGNPNHKPLEAQLNNPEMFDFRVTSLMDKLRMFLLRLRCKAIEVQHIKMINACEMVTNNSFVDAKYYESCGHQNSKYLQNMWPLNKNKLNEINDNSLNKTMNIVGSVGNLGATGNTFGLSYLGNKVLPELQKTTKAPFKINIYGGGVPRKYVKKSLNHEEIKLNGWIEDIEYEILKSDSFLVLTNATGFIVGNTRILLAWSLKACVIAHKNSCYSMPEIENNKNALIGETPEEIANLIIRASNDSDLRKKIGHGGFETYLKYYNSEVVMPKMYKQINDCFSEFHISRKL